MSVESGNRMNELMAEGQAEVNENTNGRSYEVTTPLVFDSLEPIEVSVRIAKQRYVLREASGDAACKWRNATMRYAKFGADGKLQTMGDLADCEPMLVSMCLFLVRDDGTRSPVSEKTVRSWPYKIQRDLFDRAKKISELGDEETEEFIEKRIESDKAKLSLMKNGKVETREELEKNE